MPYYKECNLLFIHIPKTGGTCIDTQICKSRKRTLYTIFSNDLLPEPYKNISLQHQFYTTIYENRTILDINFDKIKIFTIVRNPYDRMVSWYFYLKRQALKHIKNYNRSTNNYNIIEFVVNLDVAIRQK